LDDFLRQSDFTFGNFGGEFGIQIGKLPSSVLPVSWGDGRALAQAPPLRS